MTVRGVIVLALVIVAALIVGVPTTTEGATIVVDDDSGSWANYTSIGDAVDNANWGDTILVFNGTYEETFTVVRNLTIIGNGTADTTVNGTGFDDVITITQNDVNISGLSITHDGLATGGNGIVLDNVRSVTINGTDISYTKDGIYAVDSWLLNIYDNVINDNNNTGIMLDNATDSRVLNNNCSNDDWGIVVLQGSDDNVIEGNNIHGSEHGIYLFGAETNELYSNVMTGCGIMIEGTTEAEFTHTIPTNNTVNGDNVYYLNGQIGGSVPVNAGEVILVGCTNVTVNAQTLINGDVGVLLAYSDSTTIQNSFAQDNNWYNIRAVDSNWTTIDTVIATWGANGIYIRDAVGTSIVDVNASNNDANGIWLENADRTSMSNVDVWSTGWGLKMVDSDRCAIGNVSSGDNYEGIHLSNCINNTIIDSISKYHFQGGLKLVSGSDNNVIMNLEAKENRDGFYGSSGTNNTVVGSMFSNNSRADIWLSSFALALTNSSFDTVSNTDSLMPVQNYLTIHVVEGNSSVENVDVQVHDNNTTIYATPGYGGNDTTTDADGYVYDILVTDRVYDDSSTPIDNTTSVRVNFRGWHDERMVNMSTSHTETFNYTGNETIIYVDDDNAGDPSMDGSEEHPYDTVQRGIDNSTANWTVRVWDGTYAENVVVDVEGLQLVGNGTANTTIDGSNTGTVVYVTAAGTGISGFQITDSGTNNEDSGVHFDDNTSFTLTDCLLDASQRGVFIEDTTGAYLDDLSVSNNVFGVYLLSSFNVELTASSIASNTNTGIYLDSTNNITVSGCTVHLNPTNGLYVTSGGQTYVHMTNFTSNGEGIYGTSATNVHVSDCDIISSTSNGFALRATSNVFSIEASELRSNNNGISIQQSFGGEVGNTSISDSTSNDIELSTNSEVTTYNVNFTEDEVSIDVTSTLTVKNYLTVRVVNQYGEGIKDADVMVEDNDNTEYSSDGYGGSDPQTSPKGYIEELLITDRIYDGSNTATQNITNASAKFDGEEVLVDVDMATSHIEEIEINISLEGIFFVDWTNTGDPQMNGSLEHPYDTIERALDNATDGMTIRVFDGVYEEEVVIEKEIKLKGNASDTEIKALENENGVVVNVANVTVELVYINRSAGSEVGLNGTDAAWNLTIDSVVIKGFDYGIAIGMAENLLFDNLTINNPEYAIYLLNCTNFTVMDSHLEHRELNDSASGVMVENCINGTVYNNTVYSYYYSVEIGDSWNVTIEENEFDNAYAMVYSDTEVHEVSVIDNTLTNATIGIGFLDTSFSATDVNASGNSIMYMENQAVYVFGASIVEVGWNTIENALAGVQSVSSGLVTVHNNSISEVEVAVNSQFDSGIYVHDNHIVNASEHGISLLSTGEGAYDDPEVMANGVMNATTGIQLKDVDNVQVMDNRIENSTLRGLVINTSMYLDVAGNELFNNSMNMDIYGTEIDHYYHTITKSNKVNGMTVYYRVNESDLDISGGMGYAGFVNCDGEINNADVEPNVQGMLFMNTEDLIVVNTTIGMAEDQFKLYASEIRILNTYLDENSTDMTSNSTLIVQNFLHVHANNTIGEDLEDADVQVEDNDDTIYASSGYGGSDERTDSDGYVMWIIVTDRIYYGKAGATENDTVVIVKNNTWEEVRNVTMNTTHTEWFNEGGSAGNERPLVSIVDPAEDDTVGGEYEINGNASDPDGTVVRVEVKIDWNGTWHTCTGTEIWSYRWNTSEVEDGEHAIFARSWDGDLYSAEDIVNVTVDNTNFAPNISITEPMEDEVVEGEIPVKGNATDQDGGEDIDLVEVAITMNGSDPESEDWNDAEDTSDNNTWESWEYLWNTSEGDDGEYTIWARAYDGTAYSDWASVNITVYNPDPPTVEILDPTEGMEINATYFVNGTADDPDENDEVISVWVAITEAGEDASGWELANDTSENGTWETWTYEWDSTEVVDGNYTVHAMSYDGNETSEIDTVNVTVENVNFVPRTVTEDPEEDEGVSGTINVTGFVRDTDDEIESINVSIDDDDFEDDLLDVTFEKVAWDRWDWWAEWDTSEWNQGEYTIYARAIDERGMESNTWAVNVTVYENIPPTLNFTNPEEGVNDDVYKGETESYFIQWEDDDPDDDATIDLYYDEDDDGEDGTEIVTGLSEDEEDGSGHEKDDYEWDIFDVDEGTYYIYAVLSDGENADVVVVSDGTITIHEGSPNEAPEIEITQPNGSKEDRIDEDGSYTIYFNASDIDEDDLTIRLYYDNDTDTSAYKGEITDGALDQDDTEYTWTTNAITGEFYIHAKVNDGTVEVWETSPGTLTIGDVIAPAGVGNLTVEDTGFGGDLGITFTMPGDDRWSGDIAYYMIRSSSSSIDDEDDWDDASNSMTLYWPTTPGEEVEFTLSHDFQVDTEYHVAVRAFDDADNMGPIESGSATPTLVETTGRTIRSLPSGYGAQYSWLGTGTIDAQEEVGEYSIVGTGLATLDDIYVSLEATGWVSEVKLNFVYPSNLASVDVSDAKVYRRTLTGWEEVDRTGHHEGNRTIWCVLDELSIFAPLGLPIGEPEVDVTWSPQSPKEDQSVTFEVTYTDLAGREPNQIYLFADNQRISLTEVNGTPEDGIVYTATVKLDPGSYSVFAKYYWGDPEEESESTPMSLIVKEKDEEEGISMSIILGAIGGIFLVLIILMVMRGRKKKAVEKEPAKPDVVEATVASDAFEDVGEPVTAEVPVEVEATVAEPAGEVPPHIAAEAAAAAPEGVPVEAPPAEVHEVAAVPGAAPAMLTLPTVPEAPAAEVEPEVVEADLTDTGKLIFAPCPSCGNRLIIPKERPVDIGCEKCGEEFTVN